MSAGAAGKTERGRPALLIVDDEHRLLETMRHGLEAEFEIETAASAEEADLMMASREYAVLVCDHMLPGEPGLEFLIRMAKRHPRTHRILLTGYVNPELISRSMALAQLSRCLLKPVQNATLAAAIREAIG